MLVGDLVVVQEKFVDLVLRFEFRGQHLCPDACVNDLVTKAVLNGGVEKGKVDAPLLLWFFCGILRVPHAEECLVSQVHRFVDRAVLVGHKHVALAELAVHRIQLFLANLVF